MTLQGLDASNVNGGGLYAARLPLVDFAILKATEGVTFVDKTYAARIAQARAIKRLAGAYHFDRPSDDGIAQARFFVNVAAPLPGETVWLDMETQDGQPWQTVAGRAADFIRTVNALTGAKCGLYSMRSELVAVIAAADPTQRALLEAAPLWFADPDHPQGRPLSPLPWAIHQFGNIGGLDANVTHPTFLWAAVAVPSATPAPIPAPTNPKRPTMLLFQDSTGIYFLDGAGTVHVPTVPDVQAMEAKGVPLVPVSDSFGASLRGTPA